MNRDRNDIISQAINECLNELYKNSQPSISLNEITENYNSGMYSIENPHYQQHYLSQEEQQEIIEHFKHIYRINNEWNDNVQLVYDYLEKGGTKDKWIPRDGDNPGYRGYEKTLPLKEYIGEEFTNKTLELIKNCQDFYRGDHDEQIFDFNVFNYSPCTNKDTVKEYWKSKGIDIKFKKRIYNEDIEDYEYIEEN